MHPETLSEIVSRFIGSMLVSGEDARGHSTPEQFDADPADVEAQPDLPLFDSRVHGPHEIVEHAPGTVHADAVPPIEAGRVNVPGVDLRPLTTPEAFQSPVVSNGAASLSGSSIAAPRTAPVAQPGDQLALVTRQANTMSDRDVALLGDADAPSAVHDVRAAERINDVSAAIEAMSAQALVMPVGETGGPGLDRDAVRRIETDEGDVDRLIVARDGEAIGTIHDGTPIEPGDEPPSLDALRLSRDEARDARRIETEGDNGGEPSDTDRSDGVARVEAEPDGSVAVEAGGNQLLNVAAIVEAGVSAPLWAIGADLVELDVIVQTNAWSDSDTGMSSGAHPAIGDGTQAGSLATLVGHDASSADSETDTGALPATSELPATNEFPATGEFPDQWDVSVVEGDFVLIEWMVQRNTMEDGDVVSAAVSGVDARIVTGDNTQINAASVLHLGTDFDLVIVGGDLYDLNIVTQTNILIDDDRLEGTAAFEAAWGGGNVLWNQASIENIRSETTDPLSPELADAMRDLAADGPVSFPGDGAPLEVLYVKGDFLDINRIEQINVLEDADHLVIAEADCAVDATLGGNELVNIASIIDLDGYGATMVGGEHYSDALLIQAELAEGFALGGDAQGEAGNALVSEAIAFLDTDREAEDAEPMAIGADATNDYADVLAIV